MGEREIVEADEGDDAVDVDGEDADDDDSGGDDDDDEGGNDDDDDIGIDDDDAKVKISGVSRGVLAATFISISVAPLMLH